MSIATQIQNYNDGLIDAYDSVNTKGGTVPESKNLVNLPDAIESIPSGGDISEYFNETISGSYGWRNTVKQIPALRNEGTTCKDMFNSYPGSQVDVSKFDTSNVTNMEQMFISCNNLISLDLSSFDTSNVTTMTNMFNSCNNLISLDLSSFDTSNCETFFNMFATCAIETLDLSSFDFSLVDGTSRYSSASSMFNYSRNLTNLIFGTNLGKGYTATAYNTYAEITLYYSSFTHDSLMSVINNLYDISDKNPQRLSLGSTNLAKLSSEEIAIATNKGWTVS